MRIPSQLQFALLSCAVTASVQPAFSQIIFQQNPGITVVPMTVSRHVVTTPSMMVVPTRTVTTYSRTETIINSPDVLQPNVLEQSVVLAPNIGVISDFRHRLGNMRDQIAMGLAKGLMTADAATVLTARADSLAAQLDGMPLLRREENDAIEAQINLLNQDVANAMAPAVE
jgi:hypothetical protein